MTVTGADLDETPDTSVVVAGLTAWHPDHDVARPHLVGRRLVAHVLIESYSVLTRLPGARRVAPDMARAALASISADPPLVLDGADIAGLLGRVADAGINGGAVYDALVGETARRAGLTLVTLDRRARRVYDALGVTAVDPYG